MKINKKILLTSLGVGLGITGLVTISIVSTSCSNYKQAPSLKQPQQDLNFIIEGLCPAYSFNAWGDPNMSIDIDTNKLIANTIYITLPTFDILFTPSIDFPIGSKITWTSNPSSDWSINNNILTNVYDITNNQQVKLIANITDPSNTYNSQVEFIININIAHVQ